jgi:uncharacterized protein YbaR (Trm112 family)
MRAIPLPPKTVEVSYGEFVCPRCKRRTRYKHKERVRRRLIFFLPFLGDTIAEYIECQSCRQHLPLTVLRTGLSADDRQMLDALKDKLVSGISIEEAQSMLLVSGVDIPTVTRYVSVAAGIGHKLCPHCNLTFRDEVIKCHKCGRVLPLKDT